jgi:hypothetical protein
VIAMLEIDANPAVRSTERRTDYETCVDAIREARRLMSEYIDPCTPSDSIETIDQIIETLDNEFVEAALKRIDGRDHFGLVEFR